MKDGFFLFGFRVTSLFFLVFFSYVLTPISLLASPKVYIDPTEGTVDREMGVFVVDVRIDVGSECINTVEAVLNYPKDQIEAVVASRGRSILSLWVRPPEIDRDRGRISFTGGLPGGYCGRIPGDPELTNVLLTIVFQPVNTLITSDQISLKFDENRSSVYLSDGTGEKADVFFEGSLFSVGDVGDLDASAWLDILNSDQTPPEVFDIKLQQDDTVFDGKYFISFSTVDKGSGLKHYKIKEEDIDNPGFVRGTDREAFFVKAESPYLIKDQTLNSRITVKAIDNAGNERLAWYEADESVRIDDSGAGWSIIQNATSLMTNTYSWIIFLLSLTALTFIFYLLFIIKKNKKKRKDQEEGVVNSNDHENTF